MPSNLPVSIRVNQVSFLPGLAESVIKHFRSCIKGTADSIGKFFKAVCGAHRTATPGPEAPSLDLIFHHQIINQDGALKVDQLQRLLVGGLIFLHALFNIPQQLIVFIFPIDHNLVQHPAVDLRRFHDGTIGMIPGPIIG